MKQKRWISALLALTLAFALLPTAAWAATAQTTAGANLTGAERQIYEAMADNIAAVVSGKQTSTQVAISFEDEELSWTVQELGLSRADNDNVVDPLNKKVDKMLGKIYTCLEYDFPFEMFWANLAWNWTWYQQHTSSKVWITRLNFSIDVTPAYRGGSTITVNQGKIAQARSVTKTAEAIVKANEGKSDYEKLAAYRDAICARTAYNQDVYKDWVKDNYMYGDPWQVIYVFDDDATTNVLCEGYAKAFKLLCDLSEFNGDVTCYIAEGKMDNEAHMWNVVRMGDGEFYLVDVTNSDTGMTGEHGGLFLAGASGSGQKYVVSNGKWRITYTYREDQAGLFMDGYLPISADSYSPDNDAPVPSFTDLLPWCSNEAVWAAKKSITNGYGSNDKFAPGVDCTQAQILTFLWRAEDKPEAAAAPITTAASYQGAINWAYEKGMIGDDFNPDAPCTRAQAVSYIWQAKNKPEAGKTASFSDVDSSAPYAKAVDWAVEKQITQGDGSKDIFAPDKVCSRGQIVCFLYRAYHN